MSQYGDRLIFSGEIAVDPIRTSGDGKYKPSDQADGCSLFLEQKEGQATGENKPAACYQIGEVEDL